MRIGEFLRFSGLLLLAWGTASWFLPFEERDAFYTDVAYNTFYVALGLILIWAGTTWNPDIRSLWTAIFGLLFVALTIAGWAVSQRSAPNAGVTNLENPADNLVHLGIAIVFLTAAWRAKSDELYHEPSGTAINLR